MADPVPAALVALAARLRAAGCVYAEDEAALLLAAGGDTELLAARRVDGEPLEQILGWAEFCGLRIAVAPAVFVPRARTGLMVRLALDHLAGRAGAVVDLCCGTGAVGAAIAAGSPVELHAADVDPAATACAAATLGPERVHTGDLYAALPAHLAGRVDVLAANAPYVPTADIALLPPEARLHEHRVALDGGADGLDVQRRVAAGAREWLAPQGILLIETSRGQAAATLATFEAAGLLAELHTDDDLDATVVSGTRPRP